MTRRRTRSIAVAALAGLAVVALVGGLVLAAFGSGGSSPSGPASSGPAPRSGGAVQSAGLACGDFADVYHQLQTSTVTPEALQAALDQVAAQASAAAASDPSTWSRLSADASALDRDVPAGAESTGADATALAGDCQVLTPA